jgi:hypothetical protein
MPRAEPGHQVPVATGRAAGELPHGALQGVAVSPPDRAFRPGSCCPRLRVLRENRSGKSPLPTQAAILYGIRRDLLILVMKAKRTSKKWRYREHH